MRPGDLGSAGARYPGALWKIGVLAGGGVLVVAVDGGAQPSFRNSEPFFHFFDRFPAVDQWHQIILLLAHMRFVDDEMPPNRVDPSRMPMSGNGRIGDESVTVLVDDHAHDHAGGRIDGSGDEG